MKFLRLNGERRWKSKKKREKWEENFAGGSVGKRIFQRCCFAYDKALDGLWWFGWVTREQGHQMKSLRWLPWGFKYFLLLLSIRVTLKFPSRYHPHNCFNSRRWALDSLSLPLTRRTPKKMKEKNGQFSNFSLRSDSGLVTKFSNVSSAALHLLEILVLINWITMLLIVPCCRSTFCWEFDWVLDEISIIFLSPSIFFPPLTLHSIFHLETTFFQVQFRCKKAEAPKLTSLTLGLCHYRESICYQTKLTNRTENAKFSENLPAQIFMKIFFAIFGHETRKDESRFLSDLWFVRLSTLIFGIYNLKGLVLWIKSSFHAWLLSVQIFVCSCVTKYSKSKYFVQVGCANTHIFLVCFSPRFWNPNLRKNYFVDLWSL